MLDPEILAHLQRQACQPRQHASFFAWYDRSADGKGIAETGIVRNLLDALAEDGVHEYSDPRPSGDRWPDCWATSQNGTATAFEVSELVDQAALPAGLSRPWSRQEVRDRLQTIISNKDLRTAGGAGSRDVVLVIHTDELYLEHAAVTVALAEHVFALPHANLARAFLLFSYDPHRRGYPFLELKLAA